MFFLSDIPFEKLGFAIPPMNQPLSTLTAPALSEVPTVVLLGSSLLYALYWITERRQEVAMAEAEEQSRSKPSAQLVPAWRGKGGQS